MFELKKPKCTPCKWKAKIEQAKDGDMIAVPEKCVNCDYRTCNIVLRTA